MKQTTTTLSLSKGRIHRPQKAVLYGPEGVGKSTLASQLPDPVFLDTEGGTHHLEVVRMDEAVSWEGILRAVRQLAQDGVVCDAGSHSCAPRLSSPGLR